MTELRSECSRLSKLCSSLCCSQTPHLEPEACKDILLKKHDAATCVLLQLSGLRCVYSILTPPFSTHQLMNDTCTGHNSNDTALITPNLVSEPNTQEIHFRTFSLKVTNCLSQHLPTLYDFLSRCLESSDQYICFCASKALVLVLLHTGVKAKVIAGIFTTLQTQVNTHVGVYCLQTVRELLNSLRKHLCTTSTPKGELLQSSCECLLQSVSENWLGTLELLLDGLSRLSGSRRQKLDSTVGEFFSLTVELFRHKHIDLSPSHKSGFLQCVLNNLLQLLSLVKMCQSVYIFKRFIDVALKSEEGSCPVEFHHFIIPSLTALLGLPVCKEIAKCWLAECGDKLPISVTITHTKRVCLECDLNQRGLIATCVRKTILVSIKCITRLLNSLFQQHPPSGISDVASLSQSSLKGVLTALCDLLLSVGLACDDTSQQYTAALYCVVSEDDDCLVDTLQASIYIPTHTIKSSITDSIPGLKTFLAITNPHFLWLHFFLGISFDHSVLLDLLLSPEINFSPVLHKYLQLVNSDWNNFEKITTSHTCSMDPIQCLPGSSSAAYMPSYSQHHRTMKQSTVTSSLGDPDIIRDDCLSSPTPKYMRHQPTVGTVLVDYSSSSSEDEETRHCSYSTDRTASPKSGPSLLEYSSNIVTLSPQLINTSEHFPNNGTGGAPSILDSSLSSVDTMLGKVMGCLIRLRMTLERLKESGLLPEHTASSAVINAIENTEELYEDSAQYLAMDDT